VVGIDFQRCIERGDVLVQRKNAADVGDRPVEQEGHALHRGVPAIGRLQVTHGAQHHIDFLDHMDRQTDGPRLVHDAALDALADPPGGIGRETETAFRVELFQGVNQAEVALFDQVEQGNAAIQVVLGDIHDQPQVVLDHFLPGGEITRPHQARRGELLLRRQQRLGADFVQIELGYILEQLKFRLRRLSFRAAAQDPPALRNPRLRRRRPRSSPGQVLGRIDRLALLADLEMQLHRIGIGIAHLGDFLTTGDLLPFLDQDLPVMGIGRKERWRCA
jgi:hypothetical protein